MPCWWYIPTDMILKYSLLSLLFRMVVFCWVVRMGLNWWQRATNILWLLYKHAQLSKSNTVNCRHILSYYYIFFCICLVTIKLGSIGKLLRLMSLKETWLLIYYNFSKGSLRSFELIITQNYNRILLLNKYTSYFLKNNIQTNISD